MIDWFSGYSAKWQVVHIDEKTWAPDGVLENCSSVSISRDADSDKLETCSMNIDVPATQEVFEEGWYRIQMIATQGAACELVNIATMLMSADSGNLDKKRNTMSISGTSVLQPAADMKMKLGDYMPKGDNGAEYAAKLLRECVVPSITVEGNGFIVDNYIVFDEGTSYLEAAWEILDTGGWVMKIGGDGRITICEKSDACSAMIGPGEGTVEPGVTYTRPITDIPNRYYAIDEIGNTAEAINTLPWSNTSYQARGRYIDVIDTSPEPINNEGLLGYVKRRLEIESTTYKQYSYTRPFHPDIWLFDNVMMNLPEFGLSGQLRVMTQNISFEKNVQVQEKAGLEIKEYIA